MDNLKILRKQHNLKQIDMAKIFNISKSTYSTYETGAYEPNIELLKKIADYFGCSIDYLVGRESEDGIIVVSGNELSKDEEHLIEILRQLNPADKDMVYRVAEMAYDVAKNG
ncbi:MAG: helix-turn-helix transcriptional regulator [Eubacteriales bacterium]|nr:helix-turn-helix transcriptional regulator [Eubacteriales bacterium]